MGGRGLACVQCKPAIKDVASTANGCGSTLSLGLLVKVTKPGRMGASNMQVMFALSRTCYVDAPRCSAPPAQRPVLPARWVRDSLAAAHTWDRCGPSGTCFGIPDHMFVVIRANSLRRQRYGRRPRLVRGSLQGQVAA
jgi:hypothetical protein